MMYILINTIIFYNIYSSINFRKILQICENDDLPARLASFGLIPAEGTFLCPDCGQGMALMSEKGQ